jgi:hypothetical protein
MKNKQATIIKIEELPKLKRTLPKIWTQAAGLLRHKRKDAAIAATTIYTDIHLSLAISAISKKTQTSKSSLLTRLKIPSKF